MKRCVYTQANDEPRLVAEGEYSKLREQAETYGWVVDGTKHPPEAFSEHGWKAISPAHVEAVKQLVLSRGRYTPARNLVPAAAGDEAANQQLTRLRRSLRAQNQWGRSNGTWSLQPGAGSYCLILWDTRPSNCAVSETIAGVSADAGQRVSPPRPKGSLIDGILYAKAHASEKVWIPVIRERIEVGGIVVLVEAAEDRGGHAAVDVKIVNPTTSPVIVESFELEAGGRGVAAVPRGRSPVLPRFLDGRFLLIPAGGVIRGTLGFPGKWREASLRVHMCERRS